MINNTQILIGLFAILLLLFVNHVNSIKRYRTVFNLIMIIESAVLTFFFDKFMSAVSILILLLSLYFFSKGHKSKNNYDVNSVFHLEDNIRKYSKYAGFSLLFITAVYEWFADRSFFSEANLLVIFISLMLIFRNYLPNKFDREFYFLILFFTLLFTFLVLPNLIYKFHHGLVGQSSEGWISNDLMVDVFLARPLSAFLSFLGYNVYSDGRNVIFENLETHTLQTVGIAESCSGIISIQVFSALFLSYIYIFSPLRDKSVIVFLLVGFFVAYIANILRMSIIVLVGHYYGMEALEYVHQNIGWFIFSTWLFIFWFFLDKVLFGKSDAINLDLREH
tara:strand:+ start:496 stop:1500 length:1005 start_codon:yes stop_codon:yes gene_type:complete